MQAAQMLGSDPALQAGDDFFGDGDVSGDYSQVMSDAGMAEVVSPVPSVPDIVAPETPAAYTGELDRYGLGGWTPEVPGDPYLEPLDITKDLRDWAKDLTGNNPTVNTVIDILATPGFVSVPTLLDPRSAKAKEEAIIEKAKTAPKGNLERIAAARAAQKAAAAAQRKADLAAQKAAARRTKLARQALKDSQAAAARAVAASAADKLAKEKAAKAVLSRLGQDRNTPSAREVAKAREVLSQIDTFGTGGQRGFMGAEIGIEDGGGYTGGDFSSGAGWE